MHNIVYLYNCEYFKWMIITNILYIKKCDYKHIIVLTLFFTHYSCLLSISTTRSESSGPYLLKPSRLRGQFWYKFWYSHLFFFHICSVRIISLFLTINSKFPVRFHLSKLSPSKLLHLVILMWFCILAWDLNTVG